MSISAHPPRRRLSVTAAIAILSLICAMVLVAVAVTWPFSSGEVSATPPPPPDTMPEPRPELLPAVGNHGIVVARMVAAFHDQGFTLVPADTDGARFDPIRNRIVAAYRFDNDGGAFVLVIARVKLVKFASGVSQMPTPLDTNEASGRLYIEYASSLRPAVLDRIRDAIRAGLPPAR